MNGADFKPDEPHSLDLASCIGASWVFGGHANTLEALITTVRPGGWVIVGEPYWQQEPSGDYLEASGCAREDFGSHSSNRITSYNVCYTKLLRPMPANLTEA